MTMKLSDFITGKEFFQELQTISGGEFPFLAEVYAPEVYNTMLTLGYGQREVFDPMVDVDFTTLTRMIYMKHRERWLGLVERELLIAGNVNKRREVTETTISTEDRVTASSGINKVSGYNSPTMIDNDGSTSTGSDGTIGEVTKSLVDEQIDVKNSYDMLTISARDSIMESVVSDVSSFLTLSIY
jgi:hypothetical protein